MNESITIVRKLGDYGIDVMLNGYYLPDIKKLPKRVYHGRIVFIHNKKQIGLPGLMHQKNCNIVIEQNLPF